MVHDIPKDAQMREILDEVPQKVFDSVFKEYLTRLQRNKRLSKFAFEDGAYLLLLDGTQYYSSKTIHCKHCLNTAP